MKKRPLCMAALVLTVLLWLLPAGIWMEDPDPAAGPAEPLKGEICRIEPGERGQAVYLKHTNLSRTGIILVYFEAEQSFSIGNTIQIKGNHRYKAPEAPRNPGQFDARLYYQSRHVVLFCYAREAVLLDGSARAVPRFLYRLRAELGERCTALLGERQGSVLGAMLLGDKTGLDQELKDIYQKSGMAHLLAVSGLHVSIFGMSLYRLLRRLGLSYPASGIPAGLLVLLYGSFTGMGTSTARAAVMFLLAVGADMLGKSYDMLTALGAAALLLLLEQPLHARNASFLLSFGAVLGIGTLYPPLEELFAVRQKGSRAFLVSLSVQLATLPLSSYFYYEIPVYGVFLNLLVIPLMTLLMTGGIAAVALSFLSMKAAWFPALVCRGILELYEEAGKAVLRLPGSVFICGKPEIWQIAVYVLGLSMFVLWSGRERKKRGGDPEKKFGNSLRKRGTWICILVLLHACLLGRFRSGLTFTMLDVGQGDGLFLETAGGTALLVDGGSSSVKEVGKYRILPYLKYRGIRVLHYAAVTHTDGDHTSGIAELLEQAGDPGGIKIETLLLSAQAEGEEAGRALRELAEKKGVSVRRIRAGDVLRDKSTSVVCLHPEAGKAYGDANGMSLVLHVVYGEFSLLLTGDLEREGEEEILKRYPVPSCRVLKAGHHGSKTSTGETWLKAVQPDLTLISCGENNSYGHPHRETLERLKEAGSRVSITARQGAVTLHSDGKTFRAESFLQEFTY